MVDRRRVAKKFKADLPLVIAKHLTVYGEQLLPGDPMPSKVPLAVRRKLWLANKAQYAKDEAPKEKVDAVVLIGSDKFASTYKIGDAEIQLGAIVAAAHISSELNAEDWNELDAEDRDIYIDLELTSRLDEEAAKIDKTVVKGSGSEEE